jgi:hypothetical protein
MKRKNEDGGAQKGGMYAAGPAWSQVFSDKVGICDPKQIGMYDRKSYGG